MGIFNGISFTEAVETKMGVQIYTTDTLGRDVTQRIVAIDNEGTVHPWEGHTGSVSNSKIRQSIGTFPNLKLEQIKEFAFQTRPYEWVQFKNVSLKPNSKTNVEIEVEKPAGQIEGQFSELLDGAVSVDIDHSPQNNRLSVQYAVMAICEAAGVPYQWDKSAELADPQQRQYTEPVHIKDVSAKDALADILEPAGLSYGLDEGGLYLHKVDSQVERAGKVGKADKLASEDLMAEGWALWRQRKLAEAEKKFKAAAKKDQTNDGVYQGLYLSEVVVFCDGFGYMPGAVEVLRENDEVTRAETDRIGAVGDGYLSLQQQAGFLFSI
jgi:hypothetical protein